MDYRERRARRWGWVGGMGGIEGEEAVGPIDKRVLYPSMGFSGILGLYVSKSFDFLVTSF